MAKVAINKCFGGFSLSKEAYDFLGFEWDGHGFAFSWEGDRANSKLIECIETLGSEAASGFHAKLKVVEIPDDVRWYITDYDGIETIEEYHRTWC